MILEVIFVTDGPGLSARIRLIFFPPLSGRIAIMKTSTPIPPIQWVKLLQKRIQRGTTSTFVRTLDPVVVNPDTASNNASTGFGITPLITNGTAPTMLSTIHPRATLANPSLEWKSLFFGFRTVSGIPITSAAAIVIKKEIPHFS